MYINRKISAYNHSGRNGNSIQFIVIHYVGSVSTAKNNVDYFAGGDRQASAHYFVDDTAIWQSVEDGNAAWHCGGPLESGHHPYHNICTNQNSIGIELCVRWRIGQQYIPKMELYYAQDLVRTLMQKYSIPANRVIRHYDVTGKNCPGCVTEYDFNHTLTSGGAWPEIHHYLTTGAEPKKFKAGFFVEEGKTFYRTAKGSLARGYVCIGQDNYYFNENAEMCTGTFKIAGRLYNFDKKGRAEQGWKTFGGKRYYFDKKGKCAIGVVFIGKREDEYCFNEEGVMQTGKQKVELTFGKDGKRVVG